jgi:hypothetical protein
MLPLRAYAVSLVSLLAGASVVHYAVRPDLTIPTYGAPEPTTKTTTKARASKR